MPDGTVVLVEMFGRAAHPRAPRRAPSTSSPRCRAARTVPRSVPTARSTSATTAAASRPSSSAGCCCPGPFDPSRYIGGRIQRVDPDTGAVTDLYTECDGRPLRAPNDLVFDGHGGFWFTDHGIRDSRRADQRPRRRSTTPMRRLGDQRGRLPGRGTERHRPVARRHALYWAETHTGRVFRRRSPRRASWHRRCRSTRAALLCGLPGFQLLDSLAVDGEGNVCVADAVNGGITVDLARRGDGRARPDRRPADHQHLLRRRRTCDTALHHPVRHRPAGAHAAGRTQGCGSTSPVRRRRRARRRRAVSGPRTGSLVATCRSASTSRRSAARRTRSTPTSSSARCSPTGWRPPTTPAAADLVVVNTCAFIEDARQETIDTILALDDRRRDGARLVVTGCMAERYGDELAEALPEVDQVAGFGVPGQRSARRPHGRLIGRAVDAGADARPAQPAPPAVDGPWAYVKIAEGCDRSCGFCAIPSFRGPQRSRDVGSILAEVDAARGARDRARRPGPRVVRQGPSRRARRRVDRAARRRPSPSASTGSACSTCTRAISPTI